MLKFILSKLKPVSALAATSQEDCLHWLRDPLSHPELETMGERQLADLPFRR